MAFIMISEKGLSLIKEFEGLFLKAYYCPAGVLTIGYGSTNQRGKHPELKPGMVITAAEANRMLREDLQDYEEDVRRLVKVPLNQSQFDALVSFQYNTGGLAKSTLLKKLNGGDYGAVPAELMRWTKADGKELNGLIRRRRAEAALWRSMDDREPAAEPAVMPQAVDPPAPTPVTSTDRLIEKLSTATPIFTALGGFADWRVGVAFAGVAVVGLILLFIYNRRSD